MIAQDTYGRQLRESHEIRFQRYVGSLPITIRQRLDIRKLYKGCMTREQIYNYYNVRIQEFTMALIQGKLITVYIEVDHTDPLQQVQLIEED